MKYIIDNIKWNNTTAAKNAVMRPIIIKQRNRNLCDTGSVRKSRKINGFTTTFRLHNGYNPSIEFIIIGQARHEKDLVLCLSRIWSDV